MSLLTVPIVKNSHILSGIYLIFFKKRSRPDFKVFRWRISTSVKRSEKKLKSKTEFSTSLQPSCFNFSLKLS